MSYTHQPMNFRLQAASMEDTIEGSEQARRAEIAATQSQHWDFPENWVAICYICRHHVYWSATWRSWCHLHYDGFTITHTATPREGDPKATLLIQEEP